MPEAARELELAEATGVAWTIGASGFGTVAGYTGYNTGYTGSALTTFGFSYWGGAYFTSGAGEPGVWTSTSTLIPFSFSASFFS